MRRAGATALLTAVLLLAQVAAVAAPAAAETAGANQHFLLLAQLENPTATLMAVGPVTGIGTLTAQSATYDEPTKSYDETDVVAVGAGTLTITVHGSFDTWPFALAPPACTQHGRISGTWAITAGSGAFAGATGGGTVSGGFFTFGPRSTTGCDTSAVRGVALGTMTGTVDLSR